MIPISQTFGYSNEINSIWRKENPLVRERNNQGLLNSYKTACLNITE